MQPIRKFNVSPSLPQLLEPLRKLAYNLHFDWNVETKDLFRRLDPDLWESSHHNPVLMLGTISQGRLLEVAEDEGFLAQMDRAARQLEDYLQERSWYQNNNINNINNYTTPCNKPTINVAQNSVISNTENFTISFTTTNISDKSTIMVKDATGLTVPYNFNAPTNTVSSGVVLKPGVNRFTLYVQNECGSASQNIEINFSDCRLPVINFSGLFQDGSSTTRQSTINLSAIIQNVEASGIMVYVNGFPRSQFTYNALNDALLSTISLNPGINTIKIEASNPCGQTYVSSEVVYDNCITPALAMVSPSTNGTSVSTAAQTITVSTSGFNGKNEFSVLLNGQNVSAFTWSNNTLTVPVTLVAGMNTITVNGTNRCVKTFS